MTIQALRIEVSLQQDGTLTLEHLPFRAGDSVEVIVLPQAGTATAALRYSLRGTAVHYERPTDPVVQEDWEVMQ